MPRWTPWIIGAGFVALGVAALFMDAPGGWLLGIAAVLTAVSGFLTSMVAIRKGQKESQSEAEKDCLRRLEKARRRVEKLVEERHELRVKLGDL